MSTVLLAGCSTTGTNASGNSGGKTHVSFALSYLPDPSLNGLAYAEKHGLFDKAGLAVDIVPWSSTPAEQVVSSGTAQFGFATDTSTALLAMASGADLKSYMAVYQHVPYDLTVRADSAYKRPADLAGTTYGGFSSPYELDVVNDMIKADGGRAKSTSVTLSVGSYDALRAKRVASVLSFPGDAYQIEQAGAQVRTWNPTDYGVPDLYSSLLIAQGAYAKSHPEIVKKMVQAVQQGYAKALEDPAAANKDLLSLYPKDLTKGQVDYVSKIQTDHLYPSADGVVGSQSKKVWQQNADWLIGHGLLVDSSGKKLSSFDASTVFTDEDLKK